VPYSLKPVINNKKTAGTVKINDLNMQPRHLHRTFQQGLSMMKIAVSSANLNILSQTDA
jgi:hypothetical protein